MLLLQSALLCPLLTNQNISVLNRNVGNSSYHLLSILWVDKMEEKGPEGCDDNNVECFFRPEGVAVGSLNADSSSSLRHLQNNI